MAGVANIMRILFPGEGRDPGRCESSARALPWAPAFAGEQEGNR
jgi:hypothetical protein